MVDCEFFSWFYLGWGDFIRKFVLWLSLIFFWVCCFYTEGLYYFYRLCSDFVVWCILYLMCDCIPSVMILV